MLPVSWLTCRFSLLQRTQAAVADSTTTTRPRPPTTTARHHVTRPLLLASITPHSQKSRQVAQRWWDGARQSVVGEVQVPAVRERHESTHTRSHRSLHYDNSEQSRAQQ
jgi:hypothetical protein